MREAAALKAQDESELTDVLKMWSLTQQTKGREVALAPWRTVQTISWGAHASWIDLHCPYLSHCLRENSSDRVWKEPSS